MTNEEDDIKEETNHSSNEDSSREELFNQEYPIENLNNMSSAIGEEDSKHPTVESPKKKSNNTIIIVVAIIAVCCIGTLIFAATTFLTPDGTHTDRIGGHDFKIPAGYERVKTETSEHGKETHYYGNPTTGYNFTLGEGHFYGMSADYAASWLANLFAENYSNTTPVNTTLNGYTTYKVDLSYIDTPSYAYIIVIDEKIYSIGVDQRIPNPDEFVEDMI